MRQTDFFPQFFVQIARPSSSAVPPSPPPARLERPASDPRKLPAIAPTMTGLR